MKRIVISQPMLMPWRGLFEQIRLSDTFVFLDDVQLPDGGGKGRSFMTRVQIKTPRGQEWLTAPVIRSGRPRQSIQETEFAPTEWRRNHLVRIQQAYRSAPYFEQVWNEVIYPIYTFQTSSLSAFCINSVRLLARRLGLSPDWYVASALSVGELTEDPSARLLKFCRTFDAQAYITGHGAANYLEHAIFDAASIPVMYMDYRLTPYPQLFGAFTPYVSIIDLLFNVGDDAPSYLNSEAIAWAEWRRVRESRSVELGAKQA